MRPTFPHLPFRLSARLAFTLALFLAVLLAVGGFLMLVQYRQAVMEARSDQIHHLETGLVASLHTLMRTGQATLIQDWLREVRSHHGLERVTILRRDGTPAFRDLETLKRVNDYLGREAFQRPARAVPAPPELDRKRFRRAANGRETSRVDWERGRIVQLVPLKQDRSCRRCHGYTDADVLGVLRLSGSLAEARDQMRDAFLHSAALGAALIGLVGLAAFLLVRWEILKPLRAVVAAARRWGAGDLRARAPERPHDEIGDLGRILNRMTDRLERNLGEVKNLISRSQTGMMVVDPHGVILFANPAAARLMNRPAEELCGSDLGLPLVDGHNTEIEVRRGSGEPGVAELSAHDIEWDGRPAFLVTFHDVTEREQAEAEARYEAFHDALTGLPNRAHLQHRLQRSIERAERRGRGLAVLFLDLDRFKEVNDTLGHAAGDELLQAIARRLQETVREEDLVARMSGDEFTLLLEGVNNRDSALRVADKLRERIFTPVTVAAQTLTPMGTIGISLYPEDGEDTETLLMHADTAMYDAKEAGRNRAHAFAADQGEAASRRFRIEQSLRRALANDELRLLYQPQLSLPGRAPDGVEALLRWEDPQDGTVSPADFVPVLEETGMILEVGEWVFRQAAADLDRWDREGLAVERVWVNVAPRQLGGHDLEQRLGRVAREQGLDPARIGIELTESGVVGDVEHSVAVLSALRERGFRIAMDDFGTGYSALTFLRRLPFDEVKIDRAFVQDIPGDAEDLALVRTIIAMAHALNLTVVAEGVETEAQARCLSEEGCDLAQGFLFARPLPADDLAAFLRAAGADQPTDTDRKG